MTFQGGDIAQNELEFARGCKNVRSCASLQPQQVGP
jgi:hypothetical protein